MRGILLVSCLGMALLGCDDGVEDTDSGTTEMDGGTSGLDCTEVCEAKFMECGAPPMVMGAQCPMVCGTSPTDEQLTCLQGEECPSVMQGVFNGMYPCDITVMRPDSGVPTDSGTPDDAGTTDDAGAATDAGTDDGGMGVNCEDRCVAKLLACGAPSETMARGRCMANCSDTTMESDVMCLEMASCDDIRTTGMMGQPLPCFE